MGDEHGARTVALLPHGRTIWNGMAGKTPREMRRFRAAGWPPGRLPSSSVDTSTIRLAESPTCAAFASAFSVSVTPVGTTVVSSRVTPLGGSLSSNWIAWSGDSSSTSGIS